MALSCWKQYGRELALRDARDTDKELCLAISMWECMDRTIANASESDLADIEVEIDRNSLFHNVIHGSRSRIHRLCVGGAAIDTGESNPFGWTALHAAAYFGKMAIMKNLIRHKAQIDPLGKGGWTPLCAAVFTGKTSCIKHLIKCRANVNHEDENGLTPLMQAMRSRRRDCMKVLLKRGADPDYRTKYDMTPMDYVIWREDSDPMIELLIKYDADVNRVDCSGTTRLTRAAMEGRSSIIKRLILHRAHVFVPDQSGKTPLRRAITFGHPACVELLVDSRADVGNMDHSRMVSWSCMDLGKDPGYLRQLFERQRQWQPSDFHQSLPKYQKVIRTMMMIRGQASGSLLSILPVELMFEVFDYLMRR